MIVMPIIALSEDIGILAREPGWLNNVALDAFVKQLRLSSLLWLAHRNLLRGDHAAHLAGRIVEVSRKNCLCRTDNHAGRFDLVFYSVGTEVTFGGGVGVGIDIEGVVGAGLHASFTANTSFVVEVYDSIRTAVESAGRTNLNAGGRIAVVTSHHAEMAAGMRKFALFDVFDPGAKHPNGHLVFLFACHGTGVTANTSILIDDESVAHREVLESVSVLLYMNSFLVGELIVVKNMKTLTVMTLI
jgi:hypothetical protein